MTPQMVIIFNTKIDGPKQKLHGNPASRFGDFTVVNLVLAAVQVLFIFLVFGKEPMSYKLSFKGKTMLDGSRCQPVNISR